MARRYINLYALVLGVIAVALEYVYLWRYGAYMGATGTGDPRNWALAIIAFLAPVLALISSVYLLFTSLARRRRTSALVHVSVLICCLLMLNAMHWRLYYVDTPAIRVNAARRVFGTKLRTWADQILAQQDSVLVQQDRIGLKYPTANLRPEFVPDFLNDQSGAKPHVFLVNAALGESYWTTGTSGRHLAIIYRMPGLGGVLVGDKKFHIAPTKWRRTIQFDRDAYLFTDRGD